MNKLKGVSQKNLDFYVLDYVKYVSVNERIKEFDHGGSKQNLFLQISRIQPIARQRFVKLGQKLSTTKNTPLKVIKYDNSRVNNNIALFEDILCTFHFVVVKEIVLNGQIAILTFRY